MMLRSFSRFFAPLLALAFLAGVLGPASPAEARERRAPPKTKKVEAVSKRVADKLNEANQLIAGEESSLPEAERYRRGLALLQQIWDMGEDKLNKHEQALVQQSFGFIYAQQEKYGKAIEAFKRTLALGALPDGTQLNLQYNLGQLYLIEGRYKEGIAALLDWFEKAENPAASAYMMMANAYAQQEKYAEALNWAEQGIAKMDEPKENWLRMTVQLRLQLKKYKDAIPGLETLLTYWPKEAYWKQLAAVYGETGRDLDSLVALEMAYRSGFFDEDREIVRLAQMYLFQEVPYKAGTLMEEHIGDGKVEKTQKNWELQGNAWMLSQELEKALGPLERAARESDEGTLYLRLGQIHIDAERWGDANKALRRASQKGGLKNPGNAHLLRGIALYNMKQYKGARGQFQLARKDPKSRKPAIQWLRVVEQEMPTQAAAAETPEAEDDEDDDKDAESGSE